MAVPEENVSDPGAAAHEAGEDGFPEVDVVVIDDKREVFADFFTPETGEVMKVAIVEEVEATRREVSDATTDLIRSSIVAEASGTRQRGEIEDVRSEQRTPRGRHGRGGCAASADDGRRGRRGGEATADDSRHGRR